MEIIRKIWNKLFEKEYTFLCVLIVISLAIHFAIIFNPPKVVFDEVHYVSDARTIITEHATNRLEHPPLAKLIITAGMVIFGDNPFGWRIFSILFGVTNILLLYLICRRLKMSRLASNFAIFLVAFENLNFVQSSVAMLDVFSLTFMLLSFWLYLRELPCVRYFSSVVGFVQTDRGLWSDNYIPSLDNRQAKINRSSYWIGSCFGNWFSRWVYPV